MTESEILQIHKPKMLGIKRGGCVPDALLGSRSWPSHIPWPGLELASAMKCQVVAHGRGKRFRLNAAGSTLGDGSYF
jgi:hypothetical protein